MGSVWRAWDLRNQAFVAAKVLGQHDSGMLLRFVREQSVRIRHPHVVAPSGWAAEDDLVVFTMDLVQRRLGRRPCSATTAGCPRATSPWCSTRPSRHSRRCTTAGVVHRDVKPANLLLEPTGTRRPHVRLGDFGVAALIDEVRLTRVPRRDRHRRLHGARAGARRRSRPAAGPLRPRRGRRADAHRPQPAPPERRARRRARGRCSRPSSSPTPRSGPSPRSAALDTAARHRRARRAPWQRDPRAARGLRPARRRATAGLRPRLSRLPPGGATRTRPADPREARVGPARRARPPQVNLSPWAPQHPGQQSGPQSGQSGRQSVARIRSHPAALLSPGGGYGAQTGRHRRPRASRRRGSRSRLVVAAGMAAGSALADGGLGRRNH